MHKIGCAVSIMQETAFFGIVKCASVKKGIPPDQDINHRSDTDLRNQVSYH
jgi:hypothetical protein